MVTASLLINILVLVPVCTALIADVEKVKITAGVFTPARGILLAMYITIIIASLLLLFFSHPEFTFALFFMQIVYKYLTPFTVKTIKNPIVISNLLIATFHLVTVYIMFQSGSITLY